MWNAGAVRRVSPPPLEPDFVGWLGAATVGPLGDKPMDYDAPWTPFEPEVLGATVCNLQRISPLSKKKPDFHILRKGAQINLFEPFYEGLLLLLLSSLRRGANPSPVLSSPSPALTPLLPNPLLPAQGTSPTFPLFPMSESTTRGTLTNNSGTNVTQEILIGIF